MYFLVFGILFCVSIFLFVFRLNLSAKESFQSLCNWCDAGDEFRQWREDNPYIYIGLSDKGKALLTKLIIAYDRYLLLHPYVHDNGYRDYLMSLFDDVPPRPNKPSPPYVLTKNPTNCWGFIFVILYNLCYNYPHICQTST